MFRIPEECNALVAALEEVVGSVRPLNDFFEVGPWNLAATYRGRKVLISVVTDDQVLHGLSFGASLGGRPITIAIHSPNTSMIGMPQVRTGDAEWDARFVAFGFPREVILDLLDPKTRRFMLDFYGPIPEGLLKPVDIDPDLRTEAGYLLSYRHLREMSGVWALPAGRVPSAEELRSWLDMAVDFADRACAAFDRAHAAIGAAHGPAAAARWVEEHRAAMAARTARRRSLRLAIYLVIAALVLVPILIVLGVLAFAILSG